MRVCLIAFFSLLLPSSALAQAAQQPSLSEIWQAAWRLETIVGSWRADEMRDADLDALDPAFDAWQASEGTEYQRYPEQLGRLLSRQAYDVWTSQIDRELRDRRTLEVAR
ncbi:MAG: hypothetical protein H6Q99_3643 [Proteobacteria bacterium]|nr:hypothetical protein [Pseudomonadota bacterium]